ncbi:hypothetical protein AKJ59_00715 [candidate division MSBL1 archaeon SCGC-AAA385M02]|uniref:Gingipain domain-containing protein n=1 Tax=candidate division MSBL1 archaeon SCGC-AAA385M02 TaxID=1698287 RepID=A0A133VQ84_9EURY|nr:hypothetical protein AKJ59_00715 [candidate division MSBL1 archaeon SCGC-AAA385M02]
MPEPAALIVRPNFDKATGYAHYYIGEFLDYALDAGTLDVIDLEAEGATKQNVLEAIDRHDPRFCYMNGHGGPDTFTVQNKEVLMQTCSGDEVLIERVVLMFSCLTGQRLGPDMVQKGVKSYIGWTVSFSWIAQDEPEVDRYASGFFEAVNVMARMLVNGGSASMAMDASMEVWNRWIDYWAASDDDYASLVVQHMVHDRDNQILLGEGGATVAPPAISLMAVPYEAPLQAGIALLMLGLLG